MMRHTLRPTCLLALAALLAACAAPPAQGLLSATPTPPPAAEITLFDWSEDVPPDLLTAFTRETGIAVRFVEYSSQEEAIARVRAGEPFDLVVMGNEFVPLLAAEGLLAPLDQSLLPNFKNISPAFRDLAYDPGNRYSVPYNWGTTGLLVDEALLGQTGRWTDLWDPEHAGRVAIWSIPRHVIAMALKSLGYSANSEDPDELAEAGERLRLLKGSIHTWVGDSAEMVDLFERGAVAIGAGYAGDALGIQAAGLAVGYVVPSDGTLLWGDNFVIAANSPRQREAALLLNFLLRPESGAAITNYNYYATPNEASLPLIDPAIRENPAIFPPNEQLRNAEIVLPLSPEGQARYDALWAELFPGQ